MPIGQEAGVTSSASDCSISSNRSNGSRPSRSSLLTKVMIGTSRNRQTSKSLRVCSSMPPWYLWGGVEHHHRAVDRGQGAVGVLAEIPWAEILVARRVEQVEGEPPMFKAHHRRGDRDAALAVDRHPIRGRPPPRAARLDLARQLDRPTGIFHSVSCIPVAVISCRD